MALEQLSERPHPPDRSQQVIGLLSELSERLRKAEGERDTLKREMITIRECIQDLNDRNDQTEKAIVAIENRFDGTETQFEGAIRRLGNMEETIDKQSTEMLTILRKMEERFDQYDREYKNHASSINHYGDTLDRFDKKLEKLMQDKGRLARKLDSIEFELADIDPRLQQHSGPLGARATYKPDRFHDDDNVDESARALSSVSPTWVPPIGMNDDDVSPQPVQKQPPAPSQPAPKPAAKSPNVKWQRSFLERLNIAKITTYVAATTVTMAVIAGVILTGLSWSKNPDFLHKMSKIWGSTIAIFTPVAPPSAPAAEKVSPPRRLQPTGDITPDTILNAAKEIPDKNFFSPIIRAQMDSQMVDARKTEDNDTARLMTVAVKTPLKTRIPRDANLPSALKPLETQAFMGNANAQHDMGALYTSGQSGVMLDYTRAATWFHESARQGVANARYNLGVLSQQGLGVPKDIDVALSWYRTASLLEHPEAQYNLGIAYLEGIGVAYNPSMAAGYFEQAAKGGVIDAAYNLGIIFENGLIDTPRPFEGLFWYHLAETRGSVDGAKNVARLTRDLKINDTAFQKLFQKMAAERPELKSLINDKPLASGIVPSEPVTAAPVAPPPLTIAPSFPDQTIVKKGIALPPPPPKNTGPASAGVPTPSTPLPDTQTTARIQTMLQDEGVYSGDLDGRVGPGTTKAIRQYQTKHKLPVTGKPSTDLLTHMIARRLSDSIE